MRTLALLPAEQERIERERVERRKPWLAFTRADLPPPPKPVRDPYVWQSVADLLPIEDWS